MRTYILLVLVCLLAFGCSRSARQAPSAVLFSSGDMQAWSEADLYPEGQSLAAFRDMSDDNYTVVAANADITPQFAGNNAERRLIKQANVRIRVENLNSADSFLNGIMEQYGAYAASTSMDENSHHYTIRVPSESYDAFLGRIDGMGRMLYRSEGVDDVTVRFFDLDGRLATQRELLRTFQSYLGRADNIEDILSVERRIAELQRDIDRTGGALRDLVHSIDYSTIDLAMHGPVTVSGPQGMVLGERIRHIFSGFGNFLSGLIVVVISIIVYGIPIMLLIMAAYWILFGRVGLIKKLWQIVAGKKQSN